MSEEIKQLNLGVKLTAYTKGVLPTKLSHLENDIDAPVDGNLYGRMDGEWVDVGDVFERNIVLIDEGSGLDREQIDKTRIKLKVRKWDGRKSELPSVLEDDKIYYVYSDKPDIIMIGGTSYSDENEEFMQVIYGGKASTSNISFQMICNPMNSKGEF